MSTCRVFGYIEDGSETPIEGLRIQFLPAALPAISSSTGKAIWPYPLEVITTSTGYFEQELKVNTDFVVIIASIGLKEKIRVPDLTEKNLFTLTSIYTTGDPTPEDTSEESWE